MKNDLKDVDTLVTVSGGMESAAALLWSLKKRFETCWHTFI